MLPSKISSIHIILSAREFDLDLKLGENHPAVHTVIISGNNDTVAQEVLWSNLGSAGLRHMEAVKSLIIRDMIISIDIGRDPPERLAPMPHFSDILFANVKMCFTDEITLSGPSDPTEISYKWKGLSLLCDHGSINLRSDLEQRRLER